MSIKSKFKISIICPTYNSEKTIVETIESMLNQTYQNFEILIIDDCSTDNTLKIVEEINDSRIIIYKNEVNSGAAHSRNVGISKATGEYIAFLDSDDLWMTTKLEKQLNFMVENSKDFTYSNYEIIDYTGENVGYYLTGPKVLRHKDFLKTCYVGCLTVMYRKEICPNLQIPSSIKKRNDYALWLIISKYSDCYLVEENLAQYRIGRKSSLSSTSKIKLFEHHVFLFKTLMKFTSVKAFFYALRNSLFYFLKQIKYKRRKP